jgi:23S rRNA (cytidine1920-2'-O)/16S rRNA (cytidine1409-2'-O)-methyltransferase
LVPSRTAAQRAITAGTVEVEGVMQPKAATMITETAFVRLTAPPAPFVGRGGLKLDAALEAFPIPVEGRRALDVGASTGGFTDALLQRGAASVTALDVGYGQLDWSLRTDDRVVVVERTNFRLVDPATIGSPFDIVVADMSFISLRTVAPQLRSSCRSDGDVVLLVKPQFEVGKERVGSGGVVRRPELHREAVSSVVDALAGADLGGRGLLRSPVEGAKGNREFLLWLQPGPGQIDAGAIDRAVSS